MNEDKLKEYIDLCVPTFLIKMKTKNDKSYFFKAHKSDYNKDTTVLKFIIADIDSVGDPDMQHYREINLNDEFKNLESLKEVIIPEHKDMYKDIVTDGMKVDCGKENCGGNALKKEAMVPVVPQANKPSAIAPVDITHGREPRIKTKEQAGAVVRQIKEASKRRQPPPPPVTEIDVGDDWKQQPMGGQERTIAWEGGRKKKKKRRKKRSRSKKRRNKRKNRTKKN